MNRIYKTVWNEALAAWVAVQETAKSHGKSASSGTGGGSTVVLDRLGIKKAQRFVPAVMVSALALAAGQANAGPGFYLNDGQDINCTGLADSTGAVQYAIMGTNIHTPLQSVSGVYVPGTSFFGITPTYNPCNSVNGSGAEKRDTQTNRTLFYGNASGVNGNATDNGAKHLTLGGRLDVNSGIIGVGDRGSNGANATNSIRMGTGATLLDANKQINSIAIGVDTKATVRNAVSIGAGTEASDPSSVGEVTAVGYTAKATAAHATALGAHAEAKKDGGAAIGYGAKATGVGSVAVGRESYSGTETTPGAAVADFTTAAGFQAKALGYGAVSLGSGAKATAKDAAALGHDAEASLENSVALGNGSSTKVNASAITSATVGSITYSGFSGATNPAGVPSVAAGDQVSVGATGAERQIKHVAPGAITAASTDAINGSQLYATQAVIGNVAGSVKNILGGNAAVGADGKLSMNNIGGTGKGNIHEAIQASRTTVSSNNGSLTVTKTTNGTTGADNYDLSVNAQSLAESAQLPVVYTKADGSKVYKHTDGNFYTQPNGAGTQVPVGDVIASMQNAAGNTTAPTTLANVKAGAKDTDAVNVSQLKGAAAALGGGAGVNTDGTFKAPSYTIAKTDGTNYAPANNVGDALSNLNAEVIKPLTFAGDSGTASTRKLGQTLTVKGGVTDPTKLTNNNIGIVSDGNGTLTAKLAKNINLGADGSVQTGNTKMDNNGITIAAPTPTDPANTVSLTSGGLNNGGNKISNVADGTAPNDAVNLSQLQAMGKAAKTHYYSVNSSEQAAGSNYNNDGATGTDALAAGVKAQAAQRNSIAIGNEAEVVNSPANPSSSSIAIGDKAKAQGDLALAIGPGATVSGASAAGGIAIGSAATSNNGGMAVGSGANAGNGTPMIPGLPVRLNNNVALGDSAKVKDDTNFRVALGSFSIAGESDLTATPYKPTANANVAGVAGPGVELGEVSVGGDNTAGMGKKLYRRITNVAAGAADTDAVNVSQLKAATNKVTAGDGITVTDIANTDGSTTYKVAADTTPLAVGDGTGGNPAGKVIAPAAGNANKLATAGDIANAINNSGFNITAGGNTVGNAPVATTAKPGSTLTLKAGDGLTVKQDLDANGDQSYTYAVNAQTVVQNAQTPVVYTKADGSKVYKHTDGNFYTQPNGSGTQVPVGDVIASMQNAAGNTTAPTTLANVKSNLADTTSAVNNPAGNDRATLAANKGNNAATVNDVLNAGFTVQGNGADKDFVTHGDTINFADGQGTVAKVTSAGGVTKVQFDTPMTYVDPAGAATSTPSNKVKLVGGNAGAPVTLDNVADGTVAANSKEAVNGGQLHDLKEKGFKIAADNGTPDTVKLTETVKYAGDSNIVTTVTDNQIGFKLANSITVGPAAGGHPVTIDGNAGTVTGLTNTTWTPGAITSGRAATEDQLKAAVDDVSTVANKGWDIGNGAPAAVGTVKPGKKVDFVAGNGSTKVDVTQDATSGNSKVTVSAAPGALQYTSTNHAAGNNTPNADQFTPANQVTLVGPVGSTSGVTINNVAPAELSATSKQAVNGSQLYNTGSSTATALGGTSSFDPATGKVTAGLNVGGTTHTSVQDALNAINTTAGAGWNLKANGGTASNIAPNGTVDVVNGSNTKVTLTGNTLKVDVVDNPTFSGPVTANGGLTVGAGTTVNMGNNVITNVADGVADTDAVNKRQLNAVVGENFTNPDGTRALNVYDVAGQTMTQHTNVIAALNQVKREGTKYSHTRDNGEAPILGPTNDSSAGALGSTAQGVNAIVDAGATNGTAMGRRAHVRKANGIAIGNEAVTGGASAVAIGDGAQALGKKSISIGTGNVVRGENSGAIGDPTIINAANSYSVGNNNTIAAGSHDAFVLGNNVTATAANSVHLGSGAAAQTAATPQTAGMTTYNVGIVNGVAYNYAGGTPTGVVTVGDVGQERRIQNVAAGQVSPTSTDAINGSQLYQTTMAINNGISTTINNLSNKIDANHNKAMGGVASAMASAGLPQAYVPGKSMVAMGAATYQGRTALALGVSTISDNGRWVLKGSVNTHNHGTVGANVGMGYQW